MNLYLLLIARYLIIDADKLYTVNELAKIVCNDFGKVPVIRNLEPRNEVMHT